MKTPYRPVIAMGILALITATTALPADTSASSEAATAVRRLMHGYADYAGSNLERLKPVLRALEELYRERGETERLRQTYETHLMLAPYDSDARQGMLKLVVEQRQFAAAEKINRDYRRRYPFEVDGYVDQLQIGIAAGKPDSALEAVREWSELNMDSRQKLDGAILLYTAVAGAAKTASSNHLQQAAGSLLREISKIQESSERSAFTQADYLARFEHKEAEARRQLLEACGRTTSTELLADARFFFRDFGKPGDLAWLDDRRKELVAAQRQDIATFRAELTRHRSMKAPMKDLAPWISTFRAYLDSPAPDIRDAAFLILTRLHVSAGRRLELLDQVRSRLDSAHVPLLCLYELEALLPGAFWQGYSSQLIARAWQNADLFRILIKDAHKHNQAELASTIYADFVKAAPTRAQERLTLIAAFPESARLYLLQDMDIRIFGADASAYLRAAEMAAELGNMSFANHALRSGIRLCAFESSDYAAAADIYLALQEYRLALDMILLALEGAPTDPEFLTRKTELLLALGREAEAEVLLERLTFGAGTMPPSKEDRYQVMYDKLGTQGGYLACFLAGKILGNLSDDQERFDFILDLLSTIGNRLSMAEVSDRLPEASRAHPTLSVIHLESLYQNNELAQARTLLRRSLAQIASSAFLTLIAAEPLITYEDYAEAKTLLKQSLKTHPNHERLWEKLKEVAERTGEDALMAECVDQLERVRQLE